MRVDKNLKGVASKLELQQVAYSKNDAQNLAGVEFSILGDNSLNGTYVAFEGLAQSDSAKSGSATYSFTMQPAKRELPFALKLNRFTKTDYPGTEEASAYSSEVAVQGGGLAWNATIGMNQPLRYKGYTLYQSSFIEENGKRLTVLAAVKNAGEWFPYIAVSMLCVGLLLHLVIKLRGRPA